MRERQRRRGRGREGRRAGGHETAVPGVKFTVNEADRIPGARDAYGLQHATVAELLGDAVREGGREGRREGQRERGRDGRREGEVACVGGIEWASTNQSTGCPSLTPSFLPSLPPSLPLSLPKAVEGVTDVQVVGFEATDIVGPGLMDLGHELQELREGGREGGREEGGCSGWVEGGREGGRERSSPGV